MLIVVTGLSGSGKTSIMQSSRFIKSICLDEYVKQKLYRRHQKGYKLVKKHFGNRFVFFWKVDTKELFEHVRDNKNNLTKLNNLIAPLVKKYLYRLSIDSKAYAIEQASYLNYEKEYAHLYQKVILIERKEKLRKSKNNLAKYHKIHFDYKIINNGTLVEAQKEYGKVLAKIFN